MKTHYLCPVCDGELVARGYCPVCRRFRKEPVIYTGDYLPNQSEDPYAAVLITERMEPGVKEGGSRITAPKMADTRFPDDCGGAHPYGVPNRDPHRAAQQNRRSTSSKPGGTTASRAAGIFALLMILIVNIGAVGSCASALMNRVRGNAERQEISADPAESPDEDLFSEEEALQREVPVYGETCRQQAAEAFSSIEPDSVFLEEDPVVYSDGEKTTNLHFEKKGVMILMALVTETEETGEVSGVSLYSDDPQYLKEGILAFVCTMEPQMNRREIWNMLGTFFDQEEDYDICIGDSTLVLFLEDGLCQIWP